MMKILWNILKKYCVIVGGLWTAMEILVAVFSQNPVIENLHNNIILYTILPLLFVMVLLIHEFRLKENFGAKSIKIHYGDILKCKNGSIVLGINNQGISESRSINKDSIHWQLIEKYGEKKVSRAIQNSSNDIIMFKPEQDEKEFLMIKMSDINEYGVAEANKVQVREAIHKLFWNQQGYDVINNTLYVPLLGTGAAGVITSKLEMIETIIKEFICFQKDKNAQRDVIMCLTIVIRWRDLVAVNPDKVAEILKQYIRYCTQCDKIDKD